ncbi:MAG: hypothetical protein IPJ69_00450 [Deltaproteobacteria bacterium]|nr:MAG: hypothetical protein IPJ69_00450 [Deltaproteobacteria bacterium]
MLEEFIDQQLFPPDITNNLKRFQDPDTGQVNIVIVIRGQDNFSRWQNRLNRLVGSTHFMKDRSTWEIKKNDGKIKIRLESVDTLKSLKSKTLKETLTPYRVIILDQENHTRLIDDTASEEIGQERERYYKILEACDFIETVTTPQGKDIRIKKNTVKYLIAGTETVSPGAGRVYGGTRNTVIAAYNLPQLLQDGFIQKPRIRVLEPEVTHSNTTKNLGPYNTHELWASLSPEERSKEVVKHIQRVWAETSDDKIGEERKIPRTVIYANSQSEARMILNELSQHIKREEISLLISDQPEGERRAQKNRFFVTHESRVLIHVLSALEGVDEYQSDPVDLVVYAAPRFAGGRNYFLNAFGSHLGGYKAPEMLDMCGLSTLNADLIFFDPLLYILSEGELKRESPQRTRWL